MKANRQLVLVIFMAMRSALLLMPVSSLAWESDTLSLTLQQAIELAHRNSPSARSARHTFLAQYWNYRYYRANYLPSLTLTSSPYINNEINKITQGDGTSLFVGQSQFGGDVGAGLGHQNDVVSHSEDPFRSVGLADACIYLV